MRFSSSKITTIMNLVSGVIILICVIMGADSKPHSTDRKSSNAIGSKPTSAKQAKNVVKITSKVGSSCIWCVGRVSTHTRRSVPIVISSLSFLYGSSFSRPHSSLIKSEKTSNSGKSSKTTSSSAKSSKSSSDVLLVEPVTLSPTDMTLLTIEGEPVPPTNMPTLNALVESLSSCTKRQTPCSEESTQGKGSKSIKIENVGGSKSEKTSNSGKSSKTSSSASSSASSDFRELATETDSTTEVMPCAKNTRGKEADLVGLTSPCYEAVFNSESSLIKDAEEDDSPHYVAEEGICYEYVDENGIPCFDDVGEEESSLVLSTKSSKSKGPTDTSKSSKSKSSMSISMTSISSTSKASKSMSMTSMSSTSKASKSMSMTNTSSTSKASKKFGKGSKAFGSKDGSGLDVIEDVYQVTQETIADAASTEMGVALSPTRPSTDSPTPAPSVIPTAASTTSKPTRLPTIRIKITQMPTESLTEEMEFSISATSPPTDQSTPAPTKSKPTRHPTIRVKITQLPTESLTEGIIGTSDASAAEDIPKVGGDEARELGAADYANEHPWPGGRKRVLQNAAEIVEEGYERIAETFNVKSTMKSAGTMLTGTDASWDESD